MDKKVTFEQLDLTPEEAKKLIDGARRFLPAPDDSIPLDAEELAIVRNDARTRMDSIRQILPKEGVDASE